MESTAKVAANEIGWKLVVHENPDTDAWACIWAAQRWVVPKDVECTVAFVRAGKRLATDECEGWHVLHMDTGLGDIDQHNKRLLRSSSFELLLKKYGLISDPGIQPILELTKATDNVEEVPLTSIHYYMKGLPHHFKDKSSNEVRWLDIMGRVFEVFDVIYSQAQSRARSQAEFAAGNYLHRLSNGITLGILLGQPNLRDAAYEGGADVVVWTQHKRKTNDFDVGIQVSRRSDVTLNILAAVLRRNEAERRAAQYAPSIDLSQSGDDPVGSKWFLHDSGKLIVCGSRTHPLAAGEFTQLGTFEIVRLAKQSLGSIQLSR